MIKVLNCNAVKESFGIIIEQVTNDSLAQLAEQLTLNQWVQGSIP